MGLLFFWLSPKLTNFVTALEFQAVESQLKTNQQHLAIQCGLKTRHDMSGAYKDLKDYNGLVGAHGGDTQELPRVWLMLKDRFFLRPSP